MLVKVINLTIFAFCFMLSINPIVYAQTAAVTPGTFYVDPSTPHCLGFRWFVTGDDANIDQPNATVAVEYKAAGAFAYKQAMPMLRVVGDRVDQAASNWQVGNLFAGSVMNLAPGMLYDIHFTMKDPDNGTVWQKDTTLIKISSLGCAEGSAS